MEKLIYALWARDGEDIRSLNQRLKNEVAPALLALDDVRGLRLNLQDESVVRAEALRQSCADTGQPQAAVQIWVEDSARPTVDSTLEHATGQRACWRVAPSTIIPNIDHPPTTGQRTPGWSQLCFLLKPERLDHATWRHNWQGLHTPVAVQTQSNFEYVQNLIVETVIEGPQDYAAIVEECFPESAMDDSYSFFDAIGDKPKFAANTKAMADSCARFIDAGGVDLLPTSQFDERRYDDTSGAA
jgi:hypothetical protein